MVFIQVAKTARDKWYELGVYLRIDLPELEEIREKHRYDLYGCLMDVLRRWTVREGINATVQLLLEACTRAKVNGIVVKVLKSMSD